MSDTSKITAAHLCRCAFVYIRQSSPQQVERNRESTDRQYRLVERAIELGWRREHVTIFDEDLGISADGIAQRSGFAHMASAVALGRVGIVFGIEVSRLARNNADWYRLLDLCGVTDTLIADSDGIYHPGLFNDRLVLGLKGTMSEAELHVMRARLNGGIRNKAARGELRRGLPVGFVWGEQDGEVLCHPDEAVTGAHPHGLRALRRDGIRAAGVAVVARAEPRLPLADHRPGGDPLGDADLHGDPPGLDQPRVCWCLCLRQDTPGALRR